MKYISYEKGKIVEEKACQSMTWIRETFSCRLELISFRNCWSMILPSGSVPKKLWPIPIFEIWTNNDVIAVMEFDRHYISNILAVFSIAFSSVMFPTGIWLYILQHKIVITLKLSSISVIIMCTTIIVIITPTLQWQTKHIQWL